MTVYHRLLEDISLRESAVDCNRCSALLKCCTYRPFVANFLVGLALESTPLPEEVLSEWDFLIVGLAPGLRYRKAFAKKGTWGFGTDEALLCSFYDRASGGCRMWKARPAVCRTFFCKSSGFDKGMAHWEKAEEFSWHLEWVLLEDFLFSEGWVLDDIAIVKKFLNEKNVGVGMKLPVEYRFEEPEKALDFYRRAWAHVASLRRAEIEEILGPHGQGLYASLLAGRSEIGY